MTALGVVDRSVDAARTAVLLVFTGMGFVAAAWGSRIPDIKQQLDLTAGGLGLLLLAMAVGTVIGLPSSGWLTRRYGSANVLRFAMVMLLAGMSFVLVGIDHIPSPWIVALGFLLVGVAIGIWDVGMNLEGATVERALGRSTMPHFHAAFSAGTVVSALIGALCAAVRFPVGLHLGLAAVLVGVVCFLAVRAFLPRPAEEAVAGDATAAEGAAAVPGPLGAWKEPRTLQIGALVMLAAFTEGTANDWLSVALVEGHHLPTWAGVLGYAVFLVLMTAGRLAGTRLLDRYGRVPVLQVMLVTACLGTVLVVFGTPVLAFAGAAVWGVGVSLGFPVGMSAASDDPAHAPARLSVVSTIGYTAFLAGPPLLGMLGDHTGVLRALLSVAVALLVALLVVPAVRERREVPVFVPRQRA